MQELLSERQRHIHQLNARHSATVSHLTKSLADLHAKNAYVATPGFTAALARFSPLR